VQLSVEPSAVLQDLVLSSTAVAVYRVMAAPPSDAGALQLTVARASLATAATPVGEPGTVAGVTELLAVDAALVPALFVAVTVKVYDVPFVKPVTTQDSAPVVVQVAPPGDAVTV